MLEYINIKNQKFDKNIILKSQKKKNQICLNEIIMHNYKINNC